ncbi:hypothetical protein [Merismopedia glauca]|uniref:Uncharacterized protein n=1 Tax=Merismopedia glauca CCAP 1448/3 TaxID=1296344 RepID=A0A2T1C7M2_9CYAN|nr:hypothetical protein [Merismopedia glauca]PSB04260.1 hypothetical protein C7B64_04685 [Merismopedia glauca CCAP 1448/3]
MTFARTQNLVQLEDLVAETVLVAMIRQEPAEISRSNNLEFKESYDDLDYLVFATLVLPFGSQVSLVRHLHSPEPGIEICVRYNQPNIPTVLAETMNAMNLTVDDLTWVHSEYKQKLYSLIAEKSKHKDFIERF